MPKCLFLVHVYYPELWDEIAARLGPMRRYGFDLVVNAVEGRTSERWRAELCRDFPGVLAIVSPNLGLDVGGTIGTLGQVDLHRYDLIRISLKSRARRCRRKCC